MSTEKLSDSFLQQKTFVNYIELKVSKLEMVGNKKNKKKIKNSTKP